MLLVAKSVRGQEFMYTWAGSILCANKHAQKMADYLNAHGFKKEEGFIWEEGFVWHVHEIPKEDYFMASYKMIIRKGVVKLKQNV